MKRTLLILITALMSFLSFAEDNWPGKCDSLEVTREMTATSDPLVFDMKITIKNVATQGLGTYCDVSKLVNSPDVSIELYFPNCYGDLAPGATKEITFQLKRANAGIEKCDLDFKVKHGTDDTRYCANTEEHWFDAPLNIEEVDRTNMTFTSTYYDLMGREISQPNAKGFYIVEKLFEDNHKSIEKIYLTEGL